MFGISRRPPCLIRDADWQWRCNRTQCKHHSLTAGLQPNVCSRVSPVRLPILLLQCCAASVLPCVPRLSLGLWGASTTKVVLPPVSLVRCFIPLAFPSVCDPACIGHSRLPNVHPQFSCNAVRHLIASCSVSGTFTRHSSSRPAASPITMTRVWPICLLPGTDRPVTRCSARRRPAPVPLPTPTEWHPQRSNTIGPSIAAYG